jgi:hypothetical protein
LGTVIRSGGYCEGYRFVASLGGSNSPLTCGAYVQANAPEAQFYFMGMPNTNCHWYHPGWTLEMLLEGNCGRDAFGLGHWVGDGQYTIYAV